MFLLEDLYPEPARLFGAFAVPSSSTKNVLVAFDTNALLLPYHIKQRRLYAPGDVYQRLASQDRLFLPARAVREFIQLRDRKLADMLQALNNQKSKFVQPDAWLSPLLDDVDEHNELSPAANAIKEHAKKHQSALVDWSFEFAGRGLPTAAV